MYSQARKSLLVLAVVTLSATATPLPMTAQAMPSAPQTPSPVTFAKTLGNSAGTTVIPVQCNAEISAAPCVLPSTALPSTAAPEWPGTVTPATRRTIFQNRLIWFGTPNPAPPPLRGRGLILTFTPLDRVPGFLRPLRGFVTRAQSFEACALGLTLTIGPYGTRTVSLNRGCA